MAIKKTTNYLKLLVTASLFSSVQSFAEDIQGIHPLLSDSFSISLGGFAASHETSANYGASSGGDRLDLNRDLGMDNDKIIPAIIATWRPANNHQLQFEYFGWSDSTNYAVNTSFEFGGKTFNIGNINTSEDFDVYRLFYGYNFLKDTSFELGAGAGLHVADLNLTISEPGVGSASATGTAPVPNLGAYGSYALSDKWLLKGRIDWLDMSVDQYSGSLTNASASVQYQAFDNFGVGLVYRYVKFELEKDTSNLDWNVDMTFDGPSLFVTTNF